MGGESCGIPLLAKTARNGAPRYYTSKPKAADRCVRATQTSETRVPTLSQKREMVGQPQMVSVVILRIQFCYLKNSIMGTALSAQPKLVVGNPRPCAIVCRIFPSS
jgi:hypothetical protein